MNILEAMEKASGPETLATAALRYLLLRSHPVRRAVLQTISLASRYGGILSDSHFACSRERQLYDGDRAVGRLDLVIETDNVVAGIESKFYATFTPNQPVKYLAPLQAYARGLGELRRLSGLRAELFVLAPESRRAELQPKLQPDGVDFMTWESLLAGLEEASAPADELSAAVARDLSLYVKAHLSYLADFRLDLELGALFRAFPRFGSETQAEFMSRVRDVLGAPGSRIDRGENWCGFYMTYRTDTQGPSYLGWFPEARFQGSGIGAQLVFASLREFELDAKWFTPFTPMKLRVPEILATPIPEILAT